MGRKNSNAGNTDRYTQMVRHATRRERNARVKHIATLRHPSSQSQHMLAPNVAVLPTRQSFDYWAVR